MISELGENRASGIIWRHTIYAIRVTFHGDFFEILWTFCITVRIILNIFVCRMAYVVCRV